jgi:adenylate kinase family enzyme
LKIRIIGSCGSGKSFIAKQLSQKYGIPYYELDNIVWDRSEDALKYPEEVRDAKLGEVLNGASWIVEGVHYKWGQDTFKEADFIFVLRPNRLARDSRVIWRFLKVRFGLETWNYKQTFRNLLQMIFEWNRGYDREGIQQVLNLTDVHAEKRFIVKRNQEILKILGQRTEAS